MKKVSKKRFEVSKINISKLNKKVVNSILGGGSRTIVPLQKENNY